MTLLWKALAALALAAGLLALGWGVGHSSGYSDGYKLAWDKQQATVDDLTTKINVATQATSDKITALETQAADLQNQLNTAQAEKLQKKNDVVVEYRKANPQTATACGWTAPTVKAINDILSVDLPPAPPTTAPPPAKPSTIAEDEAALDNLIASLEGSQ